MLKPLSIVLERLKTTITRDFCVSSDDKVEGCSTKDIKKEEMSTEEDEPQMEGEYKLENEEAYECKEEALIELDEEWLVESSW